MLTVYYISFMYTMTVYNAASASKCGKMRCSNVLDPVCSIIEPLRDLQIIGIYHNICHLKKMRCRYRHILDIRQVPDVDCNIKKTILEPSGRRVADFSIVGARQACNHSCPIYCVDTYEPACAEIWKPGMDGIAEKRMFVNHCHIDLYSCTVGVNVTVLTNSKCYRNPSAISFMSQIAALKSMNLFDD